MKTRRFRSYLSIAAAILVIAAALVTTLEFGGHYHVCTRAYYSAC